MGRRKLERLRRFGIGQTGVAHATKYRWSHVQEQKQDVISMDIVCISMRTPNKHVWFP